MVDEYKTIWAGARPEVAPGAHDLVEATPAYSSMLVRMIFEDTIGN